MRSLLSRLEKLEEHFGSVGCTCEPLIVLSETAQAPLTDTEIDAAIRACPECPTHGKPTGLVIIRRYFSVADRSQIPVAADRPTRWNSHA